MSQSPPCARSRGPRLVLGLAGALYCAIVAILILSAMLRQARRDAIASHRLATDLMSNAMVRDEDHIAWLTNRGEPLGYAWSLRVEAGETDSVGALWNLIRLATRYDDERGTRYWDAVGEALDRLDLSDPLRTPTDAIGYRVMVGGDPAYPVWKAADRLCALRIAWATARGDTREVDRAWQRRREALVAPVPSMSAHAAAERFSALTAYIEHCRKTDQLRLVLEFQDELLRVAADATSMSTGGPWREAQIRSVLAQATLGEGLPSADPRAVVATGDGD